MNFTLVLFILLLIMNLAGFASMGIDKRKAKKGAYRISEKTLFTLCIFGGALGTVCGMFYFHHKTRHWYFRYGMPLILILEAGLFLIFQYYKIPELLSAAFK